MSTSSLPRVCAALALSLTLSAAYAADTSVLGVQQELKRQQFYFEEPSGRLDEPTQAALRRYQIRKGLPITGQVDQATTDSLNGRAPAAPTVAATRPTPAATGVEQEDREFLKQVERGNSPAAPTTPPANLPAPIAAGPERTPVSERIYEEVPPARKAVATRTTATLPPTVGRGGTIDFDDAPKSRSVEKRPRVAATTSVRRYDLSESSDREYETRRTVRTVRPALPVEADDFDVEPVVTYRHTTVDTDGRVYVTERPVVTEQRVIKPFERRSREGFFHRLFRDLD